MRARKKRNNHLSLLVCLMIFATPLLTQQAIASDQIEIPMTIGATGKILIDTHINGIPVTCIVDTGSPYFLLIDETLIDKMNLEKIPTHGKLRFFAEEEGGTAYRVTIENMEVGPLQYKNIPALTISDIRRATGTGYMDLPNFWAQGIVGVAFLEHFHVRIDYSQNKITLDSTDQAPPRFVSKWRPVGLIGTPGNYIRFLMDTGSTFSIASEKTMDPLGLSYLSISSGDPLYKGLAHASDFPIGGVDFSNVTIEISDNFEKYSGHEPFQGIIGYDFLKELILDINFAQGKLSVEKP